jgi:hypothetical protein
MRNGLESGENDAMNIFVTEFADPREVQERFFKGKHTCSRILAETKRETRMYICPLHMRQAGVS